MMNRRRLGQQSRAGTVEVGHGLDDELFVYNWRPEKKRLSRSRKRRNKKQFQNGDKDRPTGEETDGNMESLDFGAEELQRLQETDETLRGIKKLVERGDPQFVRKASLIYRRSSSTEDQAVEQLVLPSRCRTEVLKGTCNTIGGSLGAQQDQCCNVFTGQACVEMWRTIADVVRNVRERNQLLRSLFR